MFIHCMENTFLDVEDRILTFRTRFMFLLGFSSLTHKGIKKFVTNSSSSQYKEGEMIIQWIPFSKYITS